MQNLDFCISGDCSVSPLWSCGLGGTFQPSCTEQPQAVTLLLTSRAHATHKRHFPGALGPAQRTRRNSASLPRTGCIFTANSQMPIRVVSAALKAQGSRAESLMCVRSTQQGCLPALCVQRLKAPVQMGMPGGPWERIVCLPLPAAQLSLLSNGHRSPQAGMLQCYSTGQAVPCWNPALQHPAAQAVMGPLRFPSCSDSHRGFGRMTAGSQTCKHPQARPREFGFQARLEI